MIDRIGIAGSFDFKLDAIDPDNHDVEVAAITLAKRLGLNISSGRGPIQTVVVEDVHPPTEN